MAPYVACETNGPCGEDCTKIAGKTLADTPRLADVRRYCQSLTGSCTESPGCAEILDDPGLRLFADDVWAPFVDCAHIPNCAKATECIDARRREQAARINACAWSAVKNP
jgi:hypothetical protein